MPTILAPILAWQARFTGEEPPAALQWLYMERSLAQQARYLEALAAFRQHFGDAAVACISAPGRTELSGNHTDHQHGCVLAASVTLDILAVTAPASSRRIRIYSQGHGLVELDCGDLPAQPSERNTTAALVRGVLAGLQQRGYRIGGFDAYVCSDVPQGSGLSSSAAFEVLIGTICNALYNEMRIPAETIAQIGKYAENEYFGKPSGLMDQMASAVGGVAFMDFADADAPQIDRIQGDFPGYALCIVNAGGSHADLTPDYAAIPQEMRMVAHACGQELLRFVPPEEFHARLPALRGTLPDRALLRTLHFFGENARVPLQAEALRAGDMPQYLQHMLDSGQSSLTLLQNIYPARDETERSISLALALAADMLRGSGAWRVHGGGFAGTIQALMPAHMLGSFCGRLQQVFGEGCCYPIAIRPVGGYAIPVDMEVRV